MSDEPTRDEVDEAFERLTEQIMNQSSAHTYEWPNGEERRKRISANIATELAPLKVVVRAAQSASRFTGTGLSQASAIQALREALAALLGKMR